MNDLATPSTAPPIARTQLRKPSADHPVTAHLTLVKAIAARIARRYRIDLCGLDVDDLVAIGTEALIDAARRFDPSRGATLTTFAYHRVQGAMVDALRANGCYRTRARDEWDVAPRQVILVSLEAHEAACRAIPDARELPDAEADARRAVGKLRAAITELPDLERRLIEGYYFDDLTLDELGAEIGTSRSWTCRLVRRATECLRAILCDVPAVGNVP